MKIRKLLPPEREDAVLAVALFAVIVVCLITIASLPFAMGLKTGTHFHFHKDRVMVEYVIPTENDHFDRHPSPSHPGCDGQEVILKGK